MQSRWNALLDTLCFNDVPSDPLVTVTAHDEPRDQLVETYVPYVVHFTKVEALLFSYASLLYPYSPDTDWYSYSFA